MTVPMTRGKTSEIDELPASSTNPPASRCRSGQARRIRCRPKALSTAVAVRGLSAVSFGGWLVELLSSRAVAACADGRRPRGGRRERACNIWSASRRRGGCDTDTPAPRSRDGQDPAKVPTLVHGAFVCVRSEAPSERARPEPATWSKRATAADVPSRLTSCSLLPAPTPTRDSRPTPQRQPHDTQATSATSARQEEQHAVGLPEGRVLGGVVHWLCRRYADAQPFCLCTLVLHVHV